jgi:CHAD domain-containing protein
MSYRLELGEPVPEALRAAAVERLERAAARLRDEHDDDPVGAVHGARKDLKKTRALVRLARPALSDKAYRRENRALRDIGREMSAGRDAAVMVQTVDALAERFAGQLPKRQFTALSRRLAAQAAAAREDASTAGLADALATAAGRAAELPVEAADRATLRRGATRAYRRGRKAFAAAERDPSPERLHEWRKRVKDLWYHQRLLRDTWKGPMKAFADECDRLGTVLGDDHDLVALTAVITRPGLVPPSVDLERLLELIAARREELQAEARELGRRVYAEKPKAFARRLGAYLAA